MQCILYRKSNFDILLSKIKAERSRNYEEKLFLSRAGVCMLGDERNEAVAGKTQEYRVAQNHGKQVLRI